MSVPIFEKSKWQRPQATFGKRHQCAGL